MRHITPIVKWLLIINLIFFVLFKSGKFFHLNLNDILGLKYFFSPYFKPYQLITHLFMHDSLLHLISNMLTLVTFGPVLEYRLKSKVFLIFYLVTGIIASFVFMLFFHFQIQEFNTVYQGFLNEPTPTLLSALFEQFPALKQNYLDFMVHFYKNNNNEMYIEQAKFLADQLYKIKLNRPLVGASGAVFAILTAFAMYYPNAGVSMLLIPIYIKAKYFVIIYAAYELYAGLNYSLTDNIAHFGHLGGVLIAYIFIKINNNWSQYNARKS